MPYRIALVSFGFILLFNIHSFAVGLSNDAILVLESPRGKEVTVTKSQELKVWVLGLEQPLYGRLLEKNEDTITLDCGSSKEKISISLIWKMQLASPERERFIGLTMIVVGGILLIFTLLIFVTIVMGYFFEGFGAYFTSVSSLAATIAFMIWGSRVKGRTYDLRRWEIKDGGKEESGREERIK